MSVLIIKNVITEGPGTIEYFLRANNIPFSIVELGSGEIPPSIERFNTLVVLGGPPGVYEMDKFPHLVIGSRLIRVAMNRDLWVLGICLGAQMIAYCLGAKVYRGPKEEIGWRSIELTGDGLRDPLMRRLALHPRVGDFWRMFEVFHWHGDTFDIPLEAVLLAQSKQYKNQAFRYRNTIYGFQFHIEVTKNIIFEWFKEVKMVKPKNKKDVIELVKKHDVKFIRLWFSDIHGQLKSFAIPKNELEYAFDEGMGFDGSSIKGFARIDESDMIALPDATTFAILPWRPKEAAVARMFCDIYEPDGSPYKGDPRYILKVNLEKAKKKGFIFYLGPELEYFYFKSDKNADTLDEGGYFDYPMDAAEDLRRDTIIALESMGVNVEYSHHEVAHSQHEIDLRYEDALTMADIVMNHRTVVKEIAKKHNVYATFMPKPIFGQNGSGMHTHQSLFKGDKNAFFNSKDKYFLSDIGKKYIAGILKHIKEITLVLNQWVNSYKRLVPGYEAPVYICWARRNRSSLVRVPLYKPGKEKATRIELRSPDPACNPYLAFACMLNAGLKGIENNYELPEPIEIDVYHLTEEERTKMEIDQLPGSLIEAIETAEKSDLLKETLGDHIFNQLIASKRVEWDEYRIKVHPCEIEQYLPML